MKRLIGLVLLISGLSFATNGQDIIIESCNAPSSYDYLETISFDFVAKNTGIVSIETYVTFYVYLSTDGVLDNNDEYVGWADLSSSTGMPVGQAVNVHFTYHGWPHSTGTYNIFIQADPLNQIIETDESNNVFQKAGVVSNEPDIDWKFVSLSVDSMGFIPDPDPFPWEPEQYAFTVNGRLKPILDIDNLGTTNTYPHLGVELYLSSDNQLSDDDVIYADLSLFTYADDDDIENDHRNDVWHYTIPGSIVPGTYYVLGKIDPDNSFPETDETNNVLASEPIVIGPSDIDLVPEAVSWASYYSSASLSLSVNVRNQGSTGAEGADYIAFLSYDQILDNSDYLFEGFDLLSNVAGGSTVSSWSSLGHSSGWHEPTPGDYYVILVVNPSETIIETDYTNNSIASASPIIHISGAIPYVTCESLSIPGTYHTTDKFFDLDFSLENTGDAISDFTNFNVYFKDASGNLVASTYFYQDVSLEQGEVKQYAKQIFIDTPLSAGIYTVEMIASENWYHPSQTSAQLTITVPQFEIAGTIRGADNVPLKKGKIFLYQKHDNGKVSFVNKALLTTNRFSFNADTRPHTLFFIPDPVTYSEYAPTILGKTLTLKDFCFFILTHDVDTIFEILKLVPLPPGLRKIKGNIHVSATAGQSAAQRISRLGEEIEGFPVVLISENGDPVKVTTTDAEGNYEFTGLPEDKYDLIVALELDQPIMQEPVPVDVTINDAVIDFAIDESVTEPKVLYSQTIAFQSWSPKTFGDEPFTPEIMVTSNLKASLSSSDTTVAVIRNNQIVIVGAGRTFITAVQEGGDNYLAAIPVQKELVVNRAPQIITAPSIAEKTFGDQEFAYAASASSKLPITYTSSNKNVATISNGAITIIGAGTTIIKSIQNGNQNYLPADPMEQTLLVKKIIPTLFVSDIPEKTFGNPAFSLSIQKDSSLPLSVRSSDTDVAVINGTRIYIKGAGTTNVIVSIKGDANHEAVEVSKILTVAKAAQGITFTELPEKNIEDGEFLIQGKATSFLPVSFASDNEAVATIIDGNIVMLHSAGIANISASQEGNNNFNPAETVTRQLVVTAVLSSEKPYIGSLWIYPNPAKEKLFIDTPEHIKSVSLTDPLGRILTNFSVDGKTIDISNVTNGLVYLTIETNKQYKTFKIYKQE